MINVDMIMMMHIMKQKNIGEYLKKQNQKKRCGDNSNIEKKVNEEHTAEEIGEGIGDLTQGEVGEALNVITNIGEPQKDPHNLE